MKNRKFWNIKIHIFVLLVLCLILTGLLWQGDKLIFGAAAGIIIIYGVFVLIDLRNMRRQIGLLLSSEAQRLPGSDRETLEQFPIPALLVTDRREILWYNSLFLEQVLDGRDACSDSLDILTDASIEDLCRTEGVLVTYREQIHRVTGMCLNKESGLHTLLFTDITLLSQEASLYRLTRPSVMLIMLDNYSDIMQQARESEKSRILGAIDQTLEEFVSQKTSSFIKRFEGDKFLIVVEEQHLEKIIEGRFSILDEIRRLETPGNAPLTLSIGVGRGEETLAQSEASARQALDMALGRGGDQAAIKNQSQYEFYGGVSKGVEKRTKVKSRIVANALSELIANADHVLVMGHKFGDLDCVGASVGMATAVRSLGKQAEVVINQDKNLANILIEMVTKDGGSGLFTPTKPGSALRPIPC